MLQNGSMHQDDLSVLAETIRVKLTGRTPLYDTSIQQHNISCTGHWVSSSSHTTRVAFADGCSALRISTTVEADCVLLCSRKTMVLDRKARLSGDEWARIWAFESARVQRESMLPTWEAHVDEKLGQTISTTVSVTGSKCTTVDHLPDHWYHYCISI